jgi:hypothetical protein
MPQHRSVKLDPDDIQPTAAAATETGTDEASAVEIERTSRVYRARLARIVRRRVMPDAAELRRVINSLPFKPFSLSVVGGREWKVKRADLVALSSSGDRIVIFDSDRPHVIRTLRVTSIAFLGKVQQ